MKIMFVCLLAGTFLVAGCGKEDELRNENDQLRQEIASKDKYIDEVTTAIEDIHDQLDHAWAMEKKVVRSAATVEGGKTALHVELIHEIFVRISDIDSTLAANQKKVHALQARLNTSSVKYTGVQKLVDDLKSNLAERERSIADLQSRVQNLQFQVQEKNRVIAMQDSTVRDYSAQISNQSAMLNTAYYVIGKRKELQGEGIISDEGGVLWGLLGTTTVVSPNYDSSYFVRLDKSSESSIDVPGQIDEIVPQRDPASYAMEAAASGHTVLKIINPADFWRDNHLVVISR